MTRATKTKSDDLSAAMNAAMEKPAASADLLERIRTAASELYAATQHAQKLELEFNDAKAKVLDLRTQALPQLLDEAGIPGLDLDESTRVERDTEVYCSISKENQSKAAKWLRENNLGSVVKESFYIPIDKGDTDKVNKIFKLLTAHNVDFAETSVVHPQTLKALVKERLAEAKPIGAAITYHTQPVVNVKAIKQSKRKKF